MWDAKWDAIAWDAIRPSLTSSAGTIYTEKKSTTLGKWHNLTVIPGYFIGFPVGNQEGFLVGEKQKRAPNHRHHNNDHYRGQNNTGHITSD